MSSVQNFASWEADLPQGENWFARPPCKSSALTQAKSGNVIAMDVTILYLRLIRPWARYVRLLILAAWLTCICSTTNASTSKPYEETQILSCMCFILSSQWYIKVDIITRNNNPVNISLLEAHHNHNEIKTQD